MNAALWLIAPLNRIINSAGKIAGAPGEASLAWGVGNPHCET